jgi:hypothetical protein
MMAAESARSYLSKFGVRLAVFGLKSNKGTGY